MLRRVSFSVAILAVCLAAPSYADEPNPRGALVNGDGPGWVMLDGDDFVRVNGDDKTLVWNGSLAIGSGKPIGVTRSVKQYKNFELLIEWQHKEFAGNSGVFVWVPESALNQLPPDELPNAGIEIQMLDHGYKAKYLRDGGKPPLFFSTNGDVFAVGESTMTPFEPLSPNGSRSFPSEDRSKGFGSWNHYYVRAINGEVRLWVNGAEVSGGRDCNPSEGYLCLESEGAPILFRNIRIRELP
ncbi:hypothetical protein Pla22_45410 [Rubripirellula amarantea]|uniref:3-keto-alpha-glucoside-1,2-lyase/3-keto-2-hydroxy-glucal hydratase domain-containing protein n=1 Tax=Rubripirellula amarantea TaxID=2527999 RepID=A0A5C5WEJ5_9BACT|nr:DUF1080 domain-containing protein [Rubripirellula amarantea]TWT49346.1 hypothetical protein Pla22_45410 [Rubripirellula amarantea]